MNYLKRAQGSGVIIVLAFSQPRSMVLQFIQNVILTGPQANLIYNGKMNRAESYFSQFDLARRDISSQSDYLLDIVSIVIMVVMIITMNVNDSNQ